MRRGLLHGAVLAVAAACQGGSYFVCEADDECVGQGGGGVCEPTGACSFPDDACPSGQRYGAASRPELAGECVGAAGATTGDPEEPPTSSGDALGSTSDADPTGPVADDTAGACPDEWWDCAWAHRQRLSLVEGTDAPLTGVPVLVLLTAGRVDHERMQADGEDVRFVAASGAVVPYEIERWDPAGVSTLWIHVDALGGAADHVWLYYGNPVAESAEDPASVWPDPFLGVWHLEDDPLDSTGLDNHASTTGTTTVVPGHIGNGRNLGSSSARLDVGPNASLADAFIGGGTISAWFRARSFGGSGFGRIADKEGGPGGAGWLLYAASGGHLRFHTWYGPKANVTWETPAEVIDLHRWVHVTVTFDALGPATPQIFVDGVPIALEDPGDVPAVDMVPSDLDRPLTLGNRPANDRRFDGILDEVRLERTTRSAEWVRVQHDSMRDALLDYGPIESWEGGP